MLPIHPIETFLQHAPPHLQEIVLELRNIIACVAPGAPWEPLKELITSASRFDPRPIQKNS